MGVPEVALADTREVHSPTRRCAGRCWRFFAPGYSPPSAMTASGRALLAAANKRRARPRPLVRLAPPAKASAGHSPWRFRPIACGSKPLPSPARSRTGPHGRTYAAPGDWPRSGSKGSSP